MIVVDTSALFAVLQSEPEGEAFFALLRDNDVYLPASVLVEANIIALGRGLTSDLEQTVINMKPQVIALDSAIASLAVGAFHRYGKGRHKGNLNFGDCLVYATAKYLRLPLLYEGQDFVHTDLPPAYPS